MNNVGECYCAECIQKRAQTEQRNENFRKYIDEIRIRNEEQAKMQRYYKQKEKEREDERQWSIIKQRLQEQDRERQRRAELEKTRRLLELTGKGRKGIVK
jgi:hypothetical protein